MKRTQLAECEKKLEEAEREIARLTAIIEEQRKGKIPPSGIVIPIANRVDLLLDYYAKHK